VLTEFLAGKVAHPEDCTLRWLEDLLNYHLIQLGIGEQIEFRHQLIQQYYTAESLLKLLPSLGEDELKANIRVNKIRELGNKDVCNLYSN
jgi:hypothetical protein